MKKLVILLCILFSCLFSSCSTDTSGYVYELTSESWKAELDGGGKLSLEFDENYAVMNLENGGTKTVIKGEYVADDKMFIIFMPEISRNYAFEYIPKGNTLDLVYNNALITLKRV
ncbi:MAG: hypothetical protein U0L20_08690 [Ruminococcus sp.]|nr:hypothetical protein [Ruminococcus sp.]